jgi:hypothetical protein
MKDQAAAVLLGAMAREAEESVVNAFSLGCAPTFHAIHGSYDRTRIRQAFSTTCEGKRTRDK